MNEPTQRVIQLFAAALELPLAEQSQFLANECAGQPRILAEVRSLLGAHDQAEAESFMRQPALQIQAHQIASELAATRSGQTIGRYQLLGLIGEGGMGEVYLAQDQELDRKVAVKLIKGNFKTQDLLRRFNNERQILAHLNHANIAGLLDGGTTDDGIPFFVMEYVEGQPIDRYADEQQLSTTDRLKLFRTVCEAVQYAHQHLVIHRDLKPTNILVTSEGAPKLLDFGIAKLLVADDSAAPDETAAVFRVMTPEYASPEQVKGEPITTATDVYSLGVVLYELLTGQPPHKFKSRQPADIAEAICTREPERPSQAVSGQQSVVRGKQKDDEQPKVGNGQTPIPQFARRGPQPGSPAGMLVRNAKSLRGDLDNIVLKALRKEPQRRYASVEQFSEDIRRHLEGLPVIARKDTFSYRAAKFIKRNMIGVAAATVILLTLIGGIIATAWQARVARAERARAERRFSEVRTLAHSVLFDYHDAIADLPGSTAVRESLVRDSLQYVDRLAQEAGDDPALQLELAEAYVKLGDILGRPYAANLGHTDGALTSYRKAHTILRRLVEAEPANREVQRNLIVAYQRVGIIQIRQGDWMSARESERQAIALSEALVSADPTNVEYRSLLARSYLHFGSATYLSGRLEDNRSALESFKEALSIQQALSAAEPANAFLRNEVEVCYGYAGYALWNIGDLTGDSENYRVALEYERRAREICESLSAADPTNAHYRRNLAGVNDDIGRSLQSLGDSRGALESRRRTIPLFEALAAADPTNAEARRDLAEAHQNVSNVMAKLGDTVGALEESRQALTILETLQSSDSTSAENRHYVVKANELTGDLLRQQGDMVAARASYQRALAVLAAWLAAEPDNAEQRTLRATEYANMGKTYAETASNARTPGRRRQETWREARDWDQKSLDIYQDMKSKGILSAADANKPDDVAREIARCDLALRK